MACPSIPGSALKGLAASYAHHHLGEGWRKGEQFHQLIFGDTRNAGYITFYDALYIPGTGRYRGKALAPDIITVHHQKYYQDAEAVPSDSDDPNPIPFLSATGDLSPCTGGTRFPRANALGRSDLPDPGRGAGETGYWRKNVEWLWTDDLSRCAHQARPSRTEDGRGIDQGTGRDGI